MGMEKHTRQKDAIYRELSSRKDHPTADEIYVSLKTDFPNISLATVYRNLRNMAESGKINVLYTDASDHFDADIKPHYHLYCTECHRLYDLDIPFIPQIDSVARQNYDGKRNSYSLIYNGVCKNCSK